MGLKKICIHWSAGTYKASALEKRHYHYICEDDGRIVNGLFKPEANIPPLRNGYYAAHCGGGNSNCIGFAFSGMAGFSSRKKVGAYPLTKKQCESGFEFLAKVSIERFIPVTQDLIFTHYEFGRQNPKTESAGKIDIVYLPPYPEVDQAQIGAFIRSKIEWYRKKLMA